MPFTFTVTDLDDQVKFLNEQAQRLETLSEQRNYRWAKVQADQMRTIGKVLLEVRREMQMTGMNGKRIG